MMVATGQKFHSSQKLGDTRRSKASSAEDADEYDDDFDDYEDEEFDAESEEAAEESNAAEDE